MEIEDLTPTLLDMGFTQEQITVAQKHSTDKSLDGLVTWITNHPNLEEFAYNSFSQFIVIFTKRKRAKSSRRR